MLKNVRIYKRLQLPLRSVLRRFGSYYPLFSGVRGRGVLGSSLSSGAARRCLRVCHEAPVDGVADAPLEAAQRLLAGLALRHLLAVVGSAPNVRPSLAYGDHDQGSLRLLLWHGTRGGEASLG